MTNMGYTSATYYGAAFTGTTSNVSLVLNRVYYSLIYINGTTTFDQIGINTRGTWSGTGSIRLGVYNNSAGKPTTVKFDAGTISCSAANTRYSITISQSLAEGWYWLAACLQSAATTNDVQSSQAFHYPGAMRYGSDAFNARQTFYQDSVSSAFATAGTLSESYFGPIIHLRAA